MRSLSIIINPERYRVPTSTFTQYPFEIAAPPSENECWRNTSQKERDAFKNRKGRRRTEKYNKYCDNAAIEISQFKLPRVGKLDPKIVIWGLDRIVWGYNRVGQSDVANPLKPLLDFLENYIGVNDNRVYFIGEQFKEKSKKGYNTVTTKLLVWKDEQTFAKWKISRATKREMEQ